MKKIALTLVLLSLLTSTFANDKSIEERIKVSGNESEAKEVCNNEIKAEEEKIVGK